ncbi:uncharacterized protein EbC_42580 [Erwinia billingiae Eb661]|uniref:Uncharacterized protein n=1 Tax=Erwinia billingiae (strain Eb661) TaxID=634500 RepID=D8MY82_ERWBE|nr:uncharacterized protein EbC_42580 [Erwinia billingiae Eb661]
MLTAVSIFRAQLGQSIPLIIQLKRSAEPLLSLSSSASLPEPQPASLQQLVSAVTEVIIEIFLMVGRGLLLQPCWL